MKRLFILLSFITVLSCSNIKKENIIYIGNPGGVTANIDYISRNGVMLAVDEFNLNQTKYSVNVISIDYQDGIPETVSEIEKINAADKPVGIVGPIPNGISMGILETINKNEIPTISPICNISSIVGKDDYFFTTSSNISVAAIDTARMVIEDNTPEARILVFQQALDNNFYNNFSNQICGELSKSGYKNFIKVPVYENSSNDYKEITEKALTFDPDAAIIIDNDINTAILAQNIKLIKESVKLYGIELAIVERTIANGGKAMENMRFSTTLNFDPSEKEVSSFIFAYKKKYADMPDGLSYLHYLSTKALLSASQDVKFDKKKIKSALLNQKKANGKGKFFDQYGDIENIVKRIIIRKGSFEKINE